MKLEWILFYPTPTTTFSDEPVRIPFFFGIRENPVRNYREEDYLKGGLGSSPRIFFTKIRKEVNINHYKTIFKSPLKVPICKALLFLVYQGSS